MPFKLQTIRKSIPDSNTKLTTAGASEHQTNCVVDVA